MRKIVHVFNAVLTIPFGVGAYILPRDMFAPFGFALDQTGVMLTKGYASTALGYGLVFWFTRGVTDPSISRGLMLASLAFNAMEAAVQLPLAIHGLAKAPIWVTAGSHTVLVLLSLWALLRPSR
jgi:hypothetical protein